MKTPTLIDVPKDSPSRKERLAAVKERHGIWTHRSKNCEQPWCALWVSEARKWLRGYNGADQDTPIELIANYCRFLDEAGLMMDGKTEWEAVQKLCAANELSTGRLSPRAEG